MKPADTGVSLVLLAILDGWAEGPEQGNAIREAKLPNIRALMERFPHTTLAASGTAVGLPPGQMGNSEVGHLNMGAGRVVYQDFTRISKSIADGDFFHNPRLVEAVDAPQPGGALHLVGLLSDGGVHSHLEHLKALLKLAKQRGTERVWVHPLLDGRDVGPKTALGYLRWLDETIASVGVGAVATVGGRYYAMDRDRRWERTERAYQAMVLGHGEKADTASQAVERAYAQDITDEFVPPTVINTSGTIGSKDSVIFFNFRPDRARQITRALVDKEFPHFPRPVPLPAHYLGMTRYDETIDIPAAFPPQELTNTLGQVVSAAGYRQLRIAETEKYAHVTYFFNGGDETPLPGEDRKLIPSPKVATYDLQPEMSAYPVTDAVCQRAALGEYKLIVLNYANPDMVGHTGNFAATVRACEVVDHCLGRVWQAVEQAGGALIICGDHGNADQMLDSKGKPHTAHTANPVPFVLAWRKAKVLRHGGALCDIAPTILELLKLDQPREMTGESLIIEGGCEK